MSSLGLAIPMLQLITALILVILFLFFGRPRLGMLTGYLACLYWGYVGNMQVLIDAFGGKALGQFGFIGVGLLLTFFGMYFLIQPGR